LRATGRDEIELPTFQTMGDDPLGESDGPERVGLPLASIMQRCLHCHSGGGINSFNSLDSLLKPSRRQTDSQDVNYGPRFWNEEEALWWKQNRYDWGLLNGYWKKGL
jgi:hypothetical protein